MVKKVRALLISHDPLFFFIGSDVIGQDRKMSAVTKVSSGSLVHVITGYLVFFLFDALFDAEDWTTRQSIRVAS